ncbi:hypothetical protein DUI87_02620 [Hirundo rustica rustica]|uniref:Uncharacterized protein n=1 Tax=Hirundo rustica rustica TaxID=333673 RepID=A0A3M0L9G0_HIRRU|nr:hypothetical protein DUI87_02620 [Hirundo rustica rustica]
MLQAVEQIPLQPVEKTMVMQVVPPAAHGAPYQTPEQTSTLQPLEDHAPEQVDVPQRKLQPIERSLSALDSRDVSSPSPLSLSQLALNVVNADSAFPPVGDFSMDGPSLNMGTVTKATVAVIQFAIWVNKVRNSWIFNFLWKAGTWIQGYHTLTVCFWGYFNNGTYCEEMTPGEIFSQPFTQLFGPTPPVFEGFKSLNVNDTIQWLVLLVCLLCLAFKDKGRLTWITTLIPTLENKDTAPQPDPTPQPDPAPQPDPTPQPASGINHPDLGKEIREMGQMLKEYLSPVVTSLAPAGGKPSPCPDK